jgi:hypothetical protein
MDHGYEPMLSSSSSFFWLVWVGGSQAGSWGTQIANSNFF